MPRVPRDTSGSVGVRPTGDRPEGDGRRLALIWGGISYITQGYLVRQTRCLAGTATHEQEPMFGLDEWIASLGGTGDGWSLPSWARHATDPDHLTAVSTLFLADDPEVPAARRCLVLPGGWGMRRPCSSSGCQWCSSAGICRIWFSAGAEVDIGLLIVTARRAAPGAMATGDTSMSIPTATPMVPARPSSRPRACLEAAQGHPVEPYPPHAEALGRSPLAAFGIGMVHGVGGSAGVGVLLVGGQRQVRWRGGLTGVRGSYRGVDGPCFSLRSATPWPAGLSARRADLVPVLGAASLVFGVWYSLGALRGPGSAVGPLPEQLLLVAQRVDVRRDGLDVVIAQRRAALGAAWRCRSWTPPW